MNAAKTLLLYRMGYHCDKCRCSMHQVGDALVWDYKLHGKSYLRAAEPQIHHKDGNHRNNNPLNLTLICPMCHGRMHVKRGKV
jgi:Zn finger protein HypA/HybF involved in hydrogenase expression